MRYGRRQTFSLLAILSALAVAPAAGCMGFWAQVLHIAGHDNIPPEYEGLASQRVAVVCMTDERLYGPDAEADELAYRVETILRQQVQGIKLVRHEDVADWLDSNGQADYVQIGKATQADRVLVIEVSGFRTHENQTFYQGKADVALTVYDVKDGGSVAWRSDVEEFAHPRRGGVPTTETTEAAFRRQFVRELAAHVARRFHETQFDEPFARDQSPR